MLQAVMKHHFYLLIFFSFFVFDIQRQKLFFPDMYSYKQFSRHFPFFDCILNCR